MEAYGFTRRSVVGAVEDYPPAGLRQAFHRIASPRVDGSFRLRVPDEPGRYVASLTMDFEWACGTGTASAVFSLTATEASSTP